MRKQAEVVIVGAGPVGLCAALFLVKRGVRVLVLEAEKALPRDMRASTFHPPTLDMLDESGIAAQLVERGHRAQRWQYLRLDTNDAAIFDLSVLGDRTRHAYRLQCEQFHLTELLLEYLLRDSLFEIEFGARVMAIEQDGLGVQARLEGEGASFEARGQFLVGADGARSFVRQALGLELTGDTYPATSITVVVDFPFERHLPHMLHVNYVWTARDHYSLMRVGRCWRTGFAPTAGQSVEDAIAMSNVQEHLKRILPSDEDYRVTHVAPYTIHRRLSATFGRERVLLAGDAAHLNSPAGGMGMNSGIHDARHLASALHCALRTGQMRALDEYATARRTVAQEHVQALSDRNHRRHREKDAQQRELIWRELKSTAEDPRAMREFLLKSSMIASLDQFPVPL
jgi:3-(3-hydroxy-phenyl)propionate hydroxylase